MNITENSLSKKQAEFIEAGLNGDNIFLTGKAGTGKSFVTKELIRLLTKQRKNVVALAPTGIAANNSTAGRTMLANGFGATSAMKTDVNNAIGTPITIAPSVAKIELIIMYPIP